MRYSIFPLMLCGDTGITPGDSRIMELFGPEMTANTT